MLSPIVMMKPLQTKQPTKQPPRVQVAAQVHHSLTLLASSMWSVEAHVHGAPNALVVIPSVPNVMGLCELDFIFLSNNHLN